MAVLVVAGCGDADRAGVAIADCRFALRERALYLFCSCLCCLTPGPSTVASSRKCLKQKRTTGYSECKTATGSEVSRPQRMEQAHAAAGINRNVLCCLRVICSEPTAPGNALDRREFLLAARNCLSKKRTTGYFQMQNGHGQ